MEHKIKSLLPGLICLFALSSCDQWSADEPGIEAVKQFDSALVKLNAEQAFTHIMDDALITSNRCDDPAQNYSVDEYRILIDNVFDHAQAYQRERKITRYEKSENGVIVYSRISEHMEAGDGKINLSTESNEEIHLIADRKTMKISKILSDEPCKDQE